MLLEKLFVTPTCSWYDNINMYLTGLGHAVAHLVEALRYKPKASGFNPSRLTMAQGLTQPFTEISTSNISWVVTAVGAWG
jgi:hypothetical protein